MTLGAGSEAYNVDSGPIIARGHLLTANDLDQAACERIREFVSDRMGRDRIQEVLSLANLTGFSTTGPSSILQEEELDDEWRIGEAFAEAYLSDNHECEFPWRSRWDQRNPNASPAGCELIGFHAVGSDARFAFGEVKTSSQRGRPSVLRGEHGLPAQVVDVRDKPEIRKWLVRHLTLRALGQPWFDRWKVAFQAFLRNPTDFVIFGVLVRDLAPDPADLQGCATRVAAGCPADTRIHLRGLYVPSGFLATFLPSSGGATP